jgi:predicted house-cleaning noncanonical NTP pyrophosphatase (MazG superfamily)
MEYNKLVRDKIPRIIRENGETPVTHVAEEEEFWEKLKEKLKEEVDEFLENNSIEEMVDVFEIITVINNLNGWDLERILMLQEQKRKERGSFDDKIILEKVE